MNDARLEADGTFTIDGVVPGPYRFHAAIPGVRAPVGKWWLKSIVAGGRDLLDLPLEIRQNITDAVATFSDQTSELAGRVTDGNGSAVAGQLVVVFSTDRTTWFPNSRRVAGIRSSADGRYAVSNPPPGDYFVTLSNEVEQGDRIDPLTLDELVAGASRVSIGVNEKKQQDLALAERVPQG